MEYRGFQIDKEFNHYVISYQSGYRTEVLARVDTIKEAHEEIDRELENDGTDV